MNTPTAKKVLTEASHRKVATKRIPARRSLSPADYAALVDDVIDDVTDRLALANRDDPADDLPAALVQRLIKGESPVKIWREHRGLKQVDLAAATGIKKARLSQIEHGATGSVEKMAALAKALGVSMDDLV